MYACKYIIYIFINSSLDADPSSAANEILCGPFCFVQADDGKILSVYYESTEKTQIFNFKKGIAAAFQANFKKTEVEIEEDTQSRHYSRYRYMSLHVRIYTRC